jgi:SHOCT-like protein
MTNEEILQKVASGEISPDEAAKLIKTSAPPRGTLYCKVSEKGAISVYGLQRMPVTLYVEQWERLLAFGDELKSFMKENDSKLKRKET